MKPIRSDLPRLKLVFFCTLAFSLAAHAYMYFTFAPTHDGMFYMIATDDEVALQISNGRFLQPVYWLLRGRLPAPWLTGMLSILFLSAGGYMIVSALGIERRLSVALLCGVLSTNMTVTATNASYIYTADTYMLAMLLACAGAWLWERLPRGGAPAAVLCFACCMGLYQAYIDVAIGLALLLLIRRILDGEKFSSLWKRAVRYGLSLLAGAAAYFVLMKLTMGVSGVAMSTDYNSLNNLLGSDLVSLLLLIPRAYFEFAALFLSPLRSYNIPAIILCRGLLGLTGLLLWVRCIRVRHIRGMELFSLVLCAALLPLGLNFIRVLDPGWVHMLMIYSFCLVYVLPLLPFETDQPSCRTVSAGRTLTAGLCACAIFFNIVLANGAYYKKQLVYEASSQYAFSIAEQIERYPDYEPGVTPVALIGDISDSRLSWDSDGYFGMYEHMTGMGGDSSFTYLGTFAAYFQFILGHPIDLITDYDQLLEIQQQRASQQMPVFPQEGSCRMQDGVLVIRLA